MENTRDNDTENKVTVDNRTEAGIKIDQELVEEFAKLFEKARDMAREDVGRRSTYMNRLLKDWDEHKNIAQLDPKDVEKARADAIEILKGEKTKGTDSEDLDKLNNKDLNERLSKLSKTLDEKKEQADKEFETAEKNLLNAMDIPSNGKEEARKNIDGKIKEVKGKFEDEVKQAKKEEKSAKTNNENAKKTVKNVGDAIERLEKGNLIEKGKGTLGSLENLQKEQEAAQSKLKGIQEFLTNINVEYKVNGGKTLNIKEFKDLAGEEELVSVGDAINHLDMYLLKKASAEAEGRKVDTKTIFAVGALAIAAKSQDSYFREAFPSIDISGKNGFEISKILSGEMTALSKRIQDLENAKDDIKTLQEAGGKFKKEREDLLLSDLSKAVKKEENETSKALLKSEAKTVDAEARLSKLNSMENSFKKAKDNRESVEKEVGDKKNKIAAAQKTLNDAIGQEIKSQLGSHEGIKERVFKDMAEQGSKARMNITLDLGINGIHISHAGLRTEAVDIVNILKTRRGAHIHRGRRLKREAAALGKAEAKLEMASRRGKAELDASYSKLKLMDKYHKEAEGYLDTYKNKNATKKERAEAKAKIKAMYKVMRRECGASVFDRNPTTKGKVKAMERYVRNQQGKFDRQEARVRSDLFKKTLIANQHAASLKKRVERLSAKAAAVKAKQEEKKRVMKGFEDIRTQSSSMGATQNTNQVIPPKRDKVVGKERS